MEGLELDWLFMSADLMEPDHRAADSSELWLLV